MTLPARLVGFVYFIQQGDDGPIKIGFSDTETGVELRRRTLQTGNPEPLIVRKVVSGGTSLERELHERFARWRLQGEWFLATPEVALAAGCADMKRGNPYRRAVPHLERSFKLGRELGHVEGRAEIAEHFSRTFETVAEEWREYREWQADPDELRVRAAESLEQIRARLLSEAAA